MDTDNIIKNRKRSRNWLSILALMSLGLFPFAMGGDFDCDFDGDGDCDCDSDGDGDFDCDSDGDGKCDYGHDHDDDSRDRMFEDAAYQAAWMQWDSSHTSPKATRSKGLQKLPDSEVKRIRRKAFIWKHKNIKVGYCTEDLIDKNVETVHILLHNQAFKRINCVPLKILGPYSRKQVGSVKSVEIDGCTSFLVSDLFPYDSNVTIYYRDKKEITVPFSGKSLRKREYSEVCDELESMGFSNVKQKPKRNIVAGLMRTDGAIDKVYINGNASFKEGEVFQYDAEVIVEYHSKLFG